MNSGPTASAPGDGSIAVSGDVASSVLITGDHNQVLVGGYLRLSDALIDPTSVYERVGLDRFVGRAWLDARVDEMLAEQDRGVLILEAGAGLGKTAYLAHLAKSRGWVQHFVETARGSAGVTRGLQNLSAQLVQRYKIQPEADQGVLPVTAGSPEFLSQLLRRAAAVLDQNQRTEPIVVVVDALDESAAVEGYNVMGLPRMLPRGVYLICSQRPVDIDWSVTPQPPRVVRLDAAETGNLADMREFLARAAERPPIARLLVSQKRTPSDFVDLLINRCRGVWIYLQYVVAAIEQGQSTALDLDALPHGVWQYYAESWMQWRGRPGWQTLTLPLLGALAATQEDATAEWLCQLTGIEHPAEVQALLDVAWRPFLTVTSSADATRYRLYHASLREFLDGRVDQDDLTTSQQSVARELANATRDAHARIAARYIEAWGGFEAGLPNVHDEAARRLDEGYGLRHVIAHLVAGGKLLDAKRLLSTSLTRDYKRPFVLPGWRGYLDRLLQRQRFGNETVVRNVWFEAKGGTADLGGYVSDQQQVWLGAEAESRRLIAQGQLAASIALEIRCALAITSVNDVAGNVGPRLLEALAKHGIIQPGMANAFALRTPDADQRMVALFRVAPLLPDERTRSEAYRAALAAMQQIRNLLWNPPFGELPAPIPDWVAKEALLLLAAEAESVKASDPVAAMAALLPVCSDALVSEIWHAAPDNDSTVLAAAALRSPEAAERMRERLSQGRGDRWGHRVSSDALVILLEGSDQLHGDVLSEVIELACERVEGMADYQEPRLVRALLPLLDGDRLTRVADRVVKDALKTSASGAALICGPVFSRLTPEGQSKLANFIQAAGEDGVARDFKASIAAAFAESGDPDAAMAIVDELGPPAGAGSYYPSAHGIAIGEVAARVPQQYVADLVRRVTKVSDARSRRTALDRLASRLTKSELEEVLAATTQIGDRHYAERVSVEAGRALAPLVRDSSLVRWAMAGGGIIGERLEAIAPFLPADALPDAASWLSRQTWNDDRARGFGALAFADPPSASRHLREALASAKKLSSERRTELVAGWLADERLAAVSTDDERATLNRVFRAGMLERLERRSNFGFVDHVKEHPALLSEEFARECAAVAARIEDSWDLRQLFRLLALRLLEPSLVVLLERYDSFSSDLATTPELAVGQLPAAWSKKGIGPDRHAAATLILEGAQAEHSPGTAGSVLRAIVHVDDAAQRLELLLTAVEFVPLWRADLRWNLLLEVLALPSVDARLAAFVRIAAVANPLVASLLQREISADTEAAESDSEMSRFDDVEALLLDTMTEGAERVRDVAESFDRRVEHLVSACAASERWSFEGLVVLVAALSRPRAEKAVEQYILLSHDHAPRLQDLFRGLSQILPSPPARIVDLLLRTMSDDLRKRLDVEAFAAFADSVPLESLLSASRKAGMYGHERKQLMAATVRRLMSVSRADAYGTWREMLRAAASGHREELCRFLASAMPVVGHLGGKDALTGVLEAVDDTEAWWP